MYKTFPVPGWFRHSLFARPCRRRNAPVNMEVNGGFCYYEETGLLDAFGHRLLTAQHGLKAARREHPGGDFDFLLAGRCLDGDRLQVHLEAARFLRRAVRPSAGVRVACPASGLGFSPAVFAYFRHKLFSYRCGCCWRGRRRIDIILGGKMTRHYSTALPGVSMPGGESRIGRFIKSPHPALVGHPSPVGTGEGIVAEGCLGWRGLVAEGGLASHSGAKRQD